MSTACFRTASRPVRAGLCCALASPGFRDTAAPAATAAFKTSRRDWGVGVIAGSSSGVWGGGGFYDAGPASSNYATIQPSLREPSPDSPDCIGRLGAWPRRTAVVVGRVPD